MNSPPTHLVHSEEQPEAHPSLQPLPRSEADRAPRLRILLLTQWFHPENNVRADFLAKSLVERGHDVQVVTGFPNYPLGRIYPGYTQRPWARQEWNGVRILRFPLYPDHSRSAVRRSLTYLTFALSSSVLSPFLIRKPDVIWVYHPPLTVGITALTLRLIRRTPFIFEIQDMWPEMIASSGMVGSPKLVRLLGALGKRIYKKAAAVSVISNGFRENLVAKGVPTDKIHVIPNWGDETNYSVQPRDKDFGERHGLLGHFNVMFAGNMGPAQDLGVLVEAARRLKSQAGIRFVLIGDGLSVPDLKAKVKAASLSNVTFIDHQPPAAMPEFLAWGDALLVQLRDEPLFKITIPSKILSYMGSGRPILCAVGGDAEEVVRDADAGITCPPGDPEALADAILRMFNMDRQQRESYGDRGRIAFEHKFSQKALVDRYERLFCEIKQRRLRKG